MHSLFHAFADHQSPPSPARTFRAAPFPASGFTLIELMVVLSVLAILTALAAPSFVVQMANTRLNSATQEMQVLLQFARAQSIYRRTAITVAGTNGDWQVKAGMELLRQAQLPDSITLTPSSDSERGLVFDTTGTARLVSEATTPYTLTLSATHATRLYCLSVTRAGLVRQQQQPASGSC